MAEMPEIALSAHVTFAGGGAPGAYSAIIEEHR